MKAGTVSHTCGNADDRAVHEPSDDAGECALHACDSDDGIGGGEQLHVGEQPVQPCDADVVDAYDLVAEHLCR